MKVFVTVFQMLGLFKLMEVLLNEINCSEGDYAGETLLFVQLQIS